MLVYDWLLYLYSMLVYDWLLYLYAGLRLAALFVCWVMAGCSTIFDLIFLLAATKFILIYDWLLEFHPGC
jgi:hypothetical protein